MIKIIIKVLLWVLDVVLLLIVMGLSATGETLTGVIFLAIAILINPIFNEKVLKPRKANKTLYNMQNSTELNIPQETVNIPQQPNTLINSVSQQPIKINNMIHSQLNKPQETVNAPQQPNTLINSVSQQPVKINNTLHSQSTRILQALPRSRNSVPIAYEYTDVKICTIRGEEPNLNLIHIGEEIKFEKEPFNQYDNKAVIVKIGNTKLGYIYRGKLQDMINDYINKHKNTVAYLSKIDISCNNQLFMNIGFYQKAQKYYDNSISFKLTANTNQDMQEAIEYSSEEDEVTFDYDYEKEKYLASTIGDIGYAPKSKNQFLEEHEDNYEAYIESIEENDNGKYVVTVTVSY